MLAVVSNNHTAIVNNAPAMLPQDYSMLPRLPMMQNYRSSGRNIHSAIKNDTPAMPPQGYSILPKLAQCCLSYLKTNFL